MEQIIPISNAVCDLSPAVRKVDLLPGQHWPVKDLLSAMQGAGRGGRGGTTGGAKDDTAAHIPVYSTGLAGYAKGAELLWPLCELDHH